MIVKQLLDLAFPNRPLSEIISSNELLELLTIAAAEYNFRKQPFFLAFTNFLLEKNPRELQKMDGTQLKKELVALFNVDTPLPTLEIDRAAYDLSGNPESASLARNMLERALISTTASLFGYLLIEEDNCAGKFFIDLDNNCRFLANRVQKMNTLFILLKELLSFNWKKFSMVGSLPTLEELGRNDVCQYVEEHSQEYLEKIQAKFIEKLEKEFKIPAYSLINSCKNQAENNDADFKLEIEHELYQSEKIKRKLIGDLEKIQLRLKAG
ncbi:MAG: hypothetical protein JSU57_01585, partial [Candidatus Heimdallarchaeota archaeon]